ncbi:MAG: hypothetical protein GF307_12295 [candidate division Zixibacteria bacterium]|nr:hypothetical protein [candidate division Zixibacteria bacterium]
MHYNLISKAVLLFVLVGGVFIGCSGEILFEPSPVHNPPSYPSPDDKAVINTPDQILYWGHQNQDLSRNYSYDLYFGNDSANLELVAEGLEENYFEASDLIQYDNAYYWKIEALDNEGNVHIGETWSFSVREHSFKIIWEVNNDEYGGVFGYHVYGDYLYLLRGSGGLSIYETADLRNPIPLFKEEMKVVCYDVCADDKYVYLYVGRSWGRWQFPEYTVVSLDISNPYQPVYAGDCREVINDQTLYVHSICKHGEYLLAILDGGYDGNILQIFHIDENGQFSLESTYRTALEVMKTYPVGDKVYLPGWKKVEILDIEDPSNPVLEHTIEIDETATGVETRGNLLFMSCLSKTYIYDNTNPTNPVKVNELSINSYDLEVSCNYLYIVNDCYITTFDIRNIQNIREVGSSYT